MSMLWERTSKGDFSVTTKHERTTPLVVCVWSDPNVHAGPWRSDDPKCRGAARIFLLRPSKSDKVHSLISRWTEHHAMSWSPRALRWQTKITGTGRNLEGPYSRRWPEAHMTWYEGEGRMQRLLFTHRTSFLTRPICRLVRNVQIRLDEKRRHDALVGMDEWDLPLPVDDKELECPEHERPWNYPYTLRYS
jgi:hypothetical protein